MKQKTGRKLLSFLLTLALVLGLMPGMNVLAEEFEPKLSSWEYLTKTVDNIYADVSTATIDGVDTTTIKLKQCIKIQYNSLSLPTGSGTRHDYILDLNGFGIRFDGDNVYNGGSVITIPKGGHLEIKDSNEGNKEYYITLNENGRATEVNTSGTESDTCIKVTGGYICGGKGTEDGIVGHYGGGIYNKGTLVMSGGTIMGNACQSAAGVWNRNNDGEAVFEFKGGTIAYNTASKSGGTGGGVINSDNGKFVMYEGAIISHNFAKGAGAVRNSLGGTFEMKGGKLVDNISRGNGGAVDNAGTFIMTGGEIKGNKSGVNSNQPDMSGYGGGVYNSSGSFTMTGGSITGNISILPGGGVANLGGQLEMSGAASISGNKNGEESDDICVNYYNTTRNIIISQKMQTEGQMYVTYYKFNKDNRKYENSTGEFAEPGSGYTITDADKSLFIPTLGTTDYKIIINTSGNLEIVENKEPSKVMTNPVANTLTYNGQEQSLVTAGEAEGGTMQYALGKDATTVPTEGWSGNIPTATDAKTYYVWYKAKGDASHSDSIPDVVSVTIKEKTDPHKHNIKKVDALDPTCTENGYKAHYECTECDKWFADASGSVEITDKTSFIIDATGHKWDDGVVTKEATYDETGIKTFTCENDPSHTKEEEIPRKVYYERESDTDNSDGSSGSSGGGSSKSSGSVSKQSIDVNGNTISSNHQAESGLPASDVGGNWGNNAEIWTYTKSDGTVAKAEWMNLDYNGLRYWYYFDSNGIMQTNWFDYNNERFYLMPEKDGWRGRMATGWKNIENKWYYFETVPGSSQGRLYRSTVTPDGHTVGADGAWNGVGETPVGQK